VLIGVVGSVLVMTRSRHVDGEPDAGDESTTNGS
jgi:hypothetical protein